MTDQRPTSDGTSPPAAALSDGLFFRMSFVAPNMYLPPDQPVRFEAVGPLGASIAFDNIASKDAYPSWGAPSVRLTVSARCRLGRRPLAFYEALSRRQAPEGIPVEHLILHPEPRMRSTDPVFREPHFVPPFLQDAMKLIEVDFKKAVERVVGLVRWRCNRTGPVALPSWGGVEWSLDGDEWKLDVRRPTMGYAEFGPDLILNQARRADLERMITDGRQEPLHQSLLREADSLRGTNPRSALVIGVTAAEVAVKTLVSTLAPATSWLVQHLPSPPIAKILEEYLPTLLPEGTAPFATDLLKRLKVAVNLRNDLVHGARETIDGEALSSAFRTVSDVVWLCDFHSGAPWALNRVDQATLAAMGLARTAEPLFGD